MKSKNLIVDYYLEPRFVLFRKYCRENKHIEMEDLNFDIIQSLKDVKGFGDKKIHQILDVYKAWNSAETNITVDDSEYNCIDFSRYNVKIESLFKGNKYKKFLQFCNDNSVVVVSDLCDMLISVFSKQPGVGRKKVEDVLQVLLNLENSYECESDEFAINDYDMLSSYELSVNELFKIFNIDDITTQDLYLSDLNNQKYQNLEKFCTVDALRLLEQYLNNFSKMEEIFNDTIDTIIPTYNELYQTVFFDRIEGSKTLEQIAEEYGKTREGIRIIEKKILTDIDTVLYKKAFYSYLQLVYFDNFVIFESELQSVFPKHYRTLVTLIKKGYTNLFYNQKFDFYSFSELQINDPPILNEQREYYLANDVISDCISYWGEVLPDLDESKVRNILTETYDFNDYGEFLSENKLSKLLCIEILLRYYLQDGIKFDDEGCHTIKRLMLEKFGIDISSDTDRTLMAKVRNNENLILIGPKQFKYFNETQNVLDLVEEISDFLDKYFDSSNFIDSKYLYSLYEQKCIENDILNDFTLYSLIKKYNSDHFTFSKSNEMCIYKSLTVRMSREEQLMNLFHSSRTVLTKQEICEKLSWPSSKLENTIGSSNLFFCGSSSKIYCLNCLSLTVEEIAILNQYYKKFQENDYCHLNRLCHELKHDSVFKNVLKKYNIENGTDLGVLIKHIKDVRVWYYMAFSNGSEKKTILDVLMSRYSDVVYRDEVITYLKNNYYEDRQINFIILSMENKNAFVHIDQNCYVNANKFTVSEDAVNALLEYIGDHEYILLNALSGYRKQLPSIQYKWTPILMANILSKNGYRLLAKHNKDYRYDYVVVVKNNSEIENLTDLVYRILNDEYEGSHNVQSIVTYMNERKVFHNREIPMEILRDDRFSLDEFKNLHWKD